MSQKAETRPALVSLGTGVYAWRFSHRQTEANSGRQILIFGWLEAAPKHLLKYIQYYYERYPGSHIVLVTSSSGDWFYRTKSFQIQRILPAVKYIITNSTSEPRILLHVFSNGGAWQLCNFAAAYQKEVGVSPSFAGVVFDSAPGRPDFFQEAQVLLLTLPKPYYLRIPMFIITFSGLCVLWTLTKLGVMADQLIEMRRILNEGLLRKAISRRLYICSPLDKQVHIQDIKEHAMEAEARGCEVTMKEFIDTAHVSHMPQHKAEYWDAINEFWAQSS